MPCKNPTCSCGDDCKCSPGNPGCEECSIAMKAASNCSAAVEESNAAMKAASTCGAVETAAGAASVATPGAVFSLLVTLQFKDADAEKDFKETFLPYAKFVEENEKNTLMYKLMASDKTPFLYNIIERYANKERDFLGSHRNSPQFKEFRATLKALQDEGRVEVNGESYYDVL